MPISPPSRQPRPERSRWFAEELALGLLGAEQRALIPSITGVFGTAGLYLRPTRNAPADLSGNMLLSVLRLHGDGAHYDGDVRCDGDRLPLADESMSLVYALHAFDTCPDPVALAAEAARVLAPEGMLVVVGLNPFSPWLMRWAGRGPRLRAAGPMRSQLTAHGLEVYRRCGLGPVWPVAGALQANAPRHGVDWLGPVRAGYALLARKRRAGYTPLPLTKPRPALALKPFAHTGCVRARDETAVPMAMTDA